MKSYGVLMIEHRMIERALRALSREADSARKTGKADTALLLRVAGFFRSYADAVHHGKEEDILFRMLGEKPISPQLRATMERLLDEHRIARGLVGKLSDSCNRNAKGDGAALGGILEAADAIMELYATHIEAEDKRFFIPAAGYFSAEEEKRMLSDFREFDRKSMKASYENMADAFR